MKAHPYHAQDHSIKLSLQALLFPLLQDSKTVVLVEKMHYIDKFKV